MMSYIHEAEAGKVNLQSLTVTIIGDKKGELHNYIKQTL